MKQSGHLNPSEETGCPVTISLSPNLQYITNKNLFKKNVEAYLWEKLLAVD